MKILEAKNLKKYYGKEPNLKKALDSASLSVEQGEYVSILGPSGSGKSSLLNLLSGLDTPTSGYVNVRGINLRDLNDEQLTIFRRRNIGFVFQNYNLIPFLNVFENIVLQVKLNGDTVEKNMLNEIVHMLHLGSIINYMPSSISNSECQRVALARALIIRPAIIFADEPTGNLDEKTGTDVIGLLKVANHWFNQTIIMATHSRNVACIADRIIKIENGKVKN